jgi:hypothetical protein
MKKFMPIISAFIPVIISIVVFDNVISSDKSINRNFQNSLIYPSYISARETLLNKATKQPRIDSKNLIRNAKIQTIKVTPSTDIAINWKSNTLIR